MQRDAYVQNVRAHLFRYSIKDGEAGGIIIASSREKAETFMKQKYLNDFKKEISCGDFSIWSFKEDDYNDEDHPEVIECYGG